MADGPTPEQQADYLVRKLEQTIRDNRTVKGMSFRTWQAIAREEIVNAIKANEKRRLQDERSTSKVVLVGASAVVTIGFWGALVAVERHWGGVAAMVFLAAGAALAFATLEWGVKRLSRRWAAQKRMERLANIEDLDKRIKRMEADMKKKLDRVKEKMEEIEV
ncbi:MAG: hypothetical protein ACM31L_16090 [Actinomycetota bacterium]